MHEAIVTISGLPGGDGVNVFYFAEGGINIPGSLNAFYTALASEVPDNVTFNIPASGKNIAAATGALTGTWSQGSASTVPGSSVSSWAAPSGAIIRWNTDGIVRNRFVTGRTFIVPLRGSAYDSDGTLLATVITSLETAGQGLIDETGHILEIWSRPLKAADGTITEQGSEHQVMTRTVPDKVAVLTSRRD